MPIEPMRENFSLKVPDANLGLKKIHAWGEERGVLAASSDDWVSLRFGSRVRFRLLGVASRAGYRSMPMLVVARRTDDRTDGRLVLQMESAEAGYFFRPSSIASAYSTKFREVYAEIQRVAGLI